MNTLIPSLFQVYFNPDDQQMQRGGHQPPQRERRRLPIGPPI
jgi:hypothetical protein